MIKLGSWIKSGPWRPFLLKAALLTATLAFSIDYIAKRYRLGIDWQVERCLPDTRAVLIDLRSDIPKRGGLIAFRGQGLEPLFADGTHMVKILVGLPGDRIEITPDRTTVNGIEVATGLDLAERLGPAAGGVCPKLRRARRALFRGGPNPTTASTADISG